MSATVTKTSKKRAASSSDDRPRKKQNIDKAAAASKPSLSRKKSQSKDLKPPAKDKGKGKAKENEPAKKRSKPVTSALVDDEAEEDDDAWTTDEAMDEDAVDGDDDAMEQDEPQGSKDPNKLSARETHKQQRAVAAERKAAKPHGQLITDAKKVWRLAHQKNISKAERDKHVAELMDLVRGKVQDVVFKHDASRIIQTLVKHGGQKERDEVAAELKGKYKELAQNKYSKFLVSKIIRHSSSHRSSILAEFHKQVVRLLLHREASSVIADAYELWANAYDRALLVRDFYGKEVLLFEENDKDKVLKGLSDVLSGTDDDKKKRILGGVKEQLELIFNNPEKGAVSHAIVHHALLEYLQGVSTLSSADDREKLRHDIFETCQELLAEMVHTKDGSRVVREFIAEGSAKDRKQIVKTLKPHVERIAKDEEAALVLMTALDVIDDTKLTTKSLLAPLFASASTTNDVALSTVGRRTLHHLLTPRATRHFTPALIAQLAATDGARERTSKKDPAVRREEVRVAASEGLVKWVEEFGAEAVKDGARGLLVLEVLLEADGDKAKAVDAVLKSGTEPDAARVFKTLLQGGHFSRAEGRVVKADAARWSPIDFARKLGRDCAKALGAFVLAEYVERIREDGTDAEQRALAATFGEPELKEIESEAKNGDLKGGVVLLEKITALKASV
ncbi:ARM repeat-containing protein [Auricularia subglabra TFB-10046 SS5]|nr:ARM repeat-containing protein [Auricularia subglabra TFB-10046 SS5]